MPFIPKTICTCIIIILTQAVFGQGDQVKFYEEIKDDSVIMFFNGNYTFTGRHCALYTRNTRIDQYGDFFQAFIDRDTNNNVLGRGYYKEGMKNGYFEIMYPNGNIKCKGEYKDNLPIGVWQYFYPDAKPERTLKFVVMDTLVDALLTDLYDENGNQLVKDGNGYFSGIISEDSHTGAHTATGKITNGVRDSVWTSFVLSMNSYTETYNKGVFVSGIVPDGYLRKSYKYTDRSRLYNFFYGQYFRQLERFSVFECLDTWRQTITKSPVPSFDLKNFRSFANDAINRVLEDDARNGNSRDYSMGENKCIISFTVNKNGVPDNFKHMSGWGSQFYTAITAALERYAKMPPNSQAVYLTFTLNVSGGTTISYNFSFSRE